MLDLRNISHRSFYQLWTPVTLETERCLFKNAGQVCQAILAETKPLIDLLLTGAWDIMKAHDEKKINKKIIISHCSKIELLEQIYTILSINPHILIPHKMFGPSLKQSAMMCANHTMTKDEQLNWVPHRTLVHNK